MANYITVDYFKERNPTVDVGQYPDATISGMITTASRWIDNILNYSLSVENITGETQDGYVDSDYNLVIFPRKRPVETVTSIVLVKGTSTITLTLTNDGGTEKFIIPTSKDRIIYPDRELSLATVSVVGSFFYLRENFYNDYHRRYFTRINYRAGYTAIPEDIQDATSLLVKEYISRGMNISGATRISQGGISMSFESRKGESDNVLDAKNIINRYKRNTPF